MGMTPQRLGITWVRYLQCADIEIDEICYARLSFIYVRLKTVTAKGASIQTYQLMLPFDCHANRSDLSNLKHKILPINTYRPASLVWRGIVIGYSTEYVYNTLKEQCRGCA